LRGTESCQNQAGDDCNANTEGKVGGGGGCAVFIFFRNQNKSNSYVWLKISTKYKNVIFYKLKAFDFAKKFEGKDNFFVSKSICFNFLRHYQGIIFFNGL